jgi:hypothetical protein
MGPQRKKPTADRPRNGDAIRPRNEASRAKGVPRRGTSDAIALLTLPANPPRPNKPFLAVASALLAAWIAFLVVLAFVSGSIRA